MENRPLPKYKKISKRIAIIPARGGSKRIPRKNLVKVNGVPIIDYVIKTAIASNLFSTILVSSDDESILKHASLFQGVSVNQRPERLSGDLTTIYSVLQYEKNRLSRDGVEFDEVWLLSATACLLEVNDLQRMSEVFDRELLMDSLLGVTEYEVPIQWAMSINSNGKLSSIDFESFLNRSQDLIKYYHDAGCIAAFRKSVFTKYADSVPEGEFHAFVLEREKALDIDYPSDLILAEALLIAREMRSL